MTNRFRLLVPVVLGLTIFLAPGSVGAKPQPAEVLAKVREILASQDSYAAAEYVQGLGEPPVVAQAYAQLVLDLNWKAKDAAGVVAMGRAGILWTLEKARELQAQSPEKVEVWRGHAKMIAYNVGSFTWPGWGDEGLKLTAAQVAVGRDAAAMNLRLAIELGRPAPKLSAAHWLVGAHALSAGDPAGAGRSFEEAVALSRKAGDEEGALMGEGYAAISRILGGDAKAAKDLDRAVAALTKRGTEDAKFYADQLTAALAALRIWRARK